MKMIPTRDHDVIPQSKMGSITPELIINQASFISYIHLYLLNSILFHLYPHSLIVSVFARAPAKHPTRWCPKIAKLVYNSNNYGL